jgi:hypothetical protein
VEIVGDRPSGITQSPARYLAQHSAYLTIFERRIVLDPEQEIGAPEAVAHLREHPVGIYLHVRRIGAKALPDEQQCDQNDRRSCFTVRHNVLFDVCLEQNYTLSPDAVVRFLFKKVVVLIHRLEKGINISTFRA